jgi:hypothetical protein
MLARRVFVSSQKTVGQPQQDYDNDDDDDKADITSEDCLFPTELDTYSRKATRNVVTDNGG